MTGEQKPGGLEGEGLSATYRFAYDSIRKGAPGLSDATCAAIARSINMKVSVAAEPAEARIRELERQLRIVQNAAKTLHHCRDTELQHLRENATFDHRLRAEHESLMERDAMMTDLLEQAEARATAAEAKLAWVVEGLKAARGFHQMTHAHAAIDQTLAALQQEGE